MESIPEALQRIRSVADYQFGQGIGKLLFPTTVEIQFSRATGRIRYINLNGERLATLRPTDGLFSLSIVAAHRLVKYAKHARFLVTVKSDVSKFVAEGGDVFAAHVVKVDESIHAKDELIVVDETSRVIGVGRALLAGPEMRAFKIGVAVKIRHGCAERCEHI